MNIIKHILPFVLALSACYVTPSDRCDYRCATDTPSGSVKKYSVVIDETIPAHQVGPMLEALAQWTTATSGAVTFATSYGRFDRSVKPPMGTIWVYQVQADLDPVYVGYTWCWNADLDRHPGRCRVWIDDNMTGNEEFRVMLHEFGHAIGLGHYEGDLPSIMHPHLDNVGDGLGPTCLDKQTVCKLWGCDPSC